MNGATQLLAFDHTTQGRVVRLRGPARSRVAVLIAVVSFHLTIGWALWSSHSASDRDAPQAHVLYARLIETNNPALANAVPAPRVPAPVVLEDLTQDLTLLPGLPSIELAADNENAVRVAPRLLDGAQPPVTEFASRGGLRPGESAFVVLRLQVMPGGTVADAVVDVSSGSRQVDEAAKAYGRATRWIAGRSGSLETPTWVRLGVRLVA